MRFTKIKCLPGPWPSSWSATGEALGSDHLSFRLHASDWRPGGPGGPMRSVCVMRSGKCIRQEVVDVRDRAVCVCRLLSRSTRGRQLSGTRQAPPGRNVAPRADSRRIPPRTPPPRRPCALRGGVVSRAPDWRGWHRVLTRAERLVESNRERAAGRPGLRGGSRARSGVGRRGGTPPLPGPASARRVDTAVRWACVPPPPLLYAPCVYRGGNRCGKTTSAGGHHPKVGTGRRPPPWAGQPSTRPRASIDGLLRQPRPCSAPAPPLSPHWAARARRVNTHAPHSLDRRTNLGGGISATGQWHSWHGSRVRESAAVPSGLPLTVAP